MKPEERKQAKETFLALLKEDPTVSLACDEAQISRDTAYRWKDRDQTFSKAWDAAVERTRDVARSSIYRRGIIGWEEPLVSMGQVVCEMTVMQDDDGKPVFDKRGKPIMLPGNPMTVRKWSDSLAALYAKANLPEYKDKPQVNINTQLADLAEQAKNELLADLAASISHEDQDQAH
jgi:hypothetical protein